MIPPKAFRLPNWAGSWAHAMESSRSLYAKYAWINGATEADYMWLTRPGSIPGERQRLEARLYRIVPRELRPPKVRLWEQANFPMATCPICLRAGYHTDIPQLLGYATCPFHDVLLERSCRNCYQPLELGCPQYPSTGPFVCRHCGEPLIPFPENTFKAWRTPVAGDLEHQALRMLARSKLLLQEAEGWWLFPTGMDGDDQRLVINSLARNHYAHFLDDRIDDLFGQPRETESVRRIHINLSSQRPAFHELRSRELEHLAHHCGVQTIQRSVGCCVKKGNMHFNSHQLPLDNLRDVISSFEADQHWRPIDSIAGAISAGLGAMPNALLMVDTLAEALIAHSAPQMLRLVLILQKLCNDLERTIDAGQSFDERQQRLLQTQRYHIALESARAGSHAYMFRIPLTAWLAPFRLRETIDGIELAVFQIWPAKGCLEHAA